MSDMSIHTNNIQAVTQHHDYTASLVNQLLEVAQQLQSIAQQLKDGHDAMGAQITESASQLFQANPQ